jgi:long-chain fatty acid transport protein
VREVKRVAAACVVLAFAARASADGFRIQQGGPSIGNSGAATAATAEDPTTIFANPAGMTRLPARAAAALVSAIDVQIQFRDKGTTIGTGARATGGNGPDAGGIAAVPAAFVSWPINERFTCGFGLTAPYGLVTDYGDHWVGRYHATKSSLSTVDLSPCVAWKVSDALSIGAGLDVQYLKAELDNALDLGTIAKNDFHIQDPEGTLGLTPGHSDGKASLQGDSFGFGGVFGVLWQADARTRFGFSFRSKVAHHVDGKATFDLSPGLAHRFQEAGLFRDTGARTTLTLPETASVGVVRDLGRGVDALLGADWTNWSRFRTLDVDFANPKQPGVLEQEQWRDGIRPAAGLTWRPDAKWTLRTGAAWDRAVAPDAYRRPRLPDNSRYSVSLGVGVKLSERATLDVEYLHAWIPRTNIDITSDDKHHDAGRLVGSYRESVDILSVQLTLAF